MIDVEQAESGPRSVIVVGAGVVGLSTAWFLQEHGVEVTVVDRPGVGAGSSAGGGGWLAPGLTLPLNSPDILRHGLRALRHPGAALRFPVDRTVGAFLAEFIVNCRHRSWRQTMRANVTLNQGCFDAFDVLLANGVDVPVTDTPVTAVFQTSAHAERLLRQLRELRNAGQTMHITALSGPALREQVPLVAPKVTAGLNINGQRFIDPLRFMTALGSSVAERGAAMYRLEIDEIISRGNGNGGISAHSADQTLIADALVIATGAPLSGLARRWLDVPVHAGCGFSFTVPVDRPMPGPIYLPSARLACTPHQGLMRVSGTTEFGRTRGVALADRVAAIVASVGPLLAGVRWAEHSDGWVGTYPITADGRPIIGELSPRVYLAGGHGMWGLTHGPVTGRLLAAQIAGGEQPRALVEFDPRRRRSISAGRARASRRNTGSARHGARDAGRSFRPAPDTPSCIWKGSDLRCPAPGNG